MNAVLLSGLSTTLARLVCRRRVTFKGWPFRRDMPRRGSRMTAGFRLAHARLHASFVLAMAVVFACAIIAPVISSASLFNV